MNTCAYLTDELGIRVFGPQTTAVNFSEVMTRDEFKRRYPDAADSLPLLRGAALQAEECQTEPSFLLSNMDIPGAKEMAQRWKRTQVPA